MTVLLQSPTEALTLAESAPGKGFPARDLILDVRIAQASTGDEYRIVPRPPMSFLYLSPVADFVSYAAHRVQQVVAPLLRALPSQALKATRARKIRYVVVDESVVPAHMNLTRLLIGHPALDVGVSAPSSPSIEIRVHTGVRAIDNLRRWLGLRIDEVTDIVGLSPSTYYYWQANPDSLPRAAKVDTLFRFHALVAALVLELGDTGASDWFRFGTPSRLQTLRQDMPFALSRLESDAYDTVERLAAARLADLPIESVTDEQHEEQLRRIDEAERMGDGLAVGVPRVDLGGDPTWHDG